jgi:hypothetical protein
MSGILNKFVTAKLAGQDDCRQGAVISTDPLRIRCQSGEEHDCEGEPTLVDNPPEPCIGCDRPLGPLCVRCERGMQALCSALASEGLRLERIEITTPGAQQ